MLSSPKIYSFWGERFRRILDREMEKRGHPLDRFCPNMERIVRLAGGEFERVGLYRPLGNQLAVSRPGKFTIRVRNGISTDDPYIRYTTAKIFAWYVLDYVGNLQKADQDPYVSVSSREAGEFARGFLLPEVLVREFMKKTRVRVSARRFGVPEKVFRKRGWELGLLPDPLDIFSSEEKAEEISEDILFFESR